MTLCNDILNYTFADYIWVYIEILLVLIVFLHVL